jgi:glutamine---fructose-6-phosphate transaminase (isomerizing)
MAQPYHMIEYIHETPRALADTLRENTSEVKQIVEIARSRGITKLVLTGLGSSFTSAMMALPLCQRFCELQTIVLQANDIDIHLGRLIDAHTLVVMVSRSGERGGVVESLLEARKLGAMGVAITGVADSLLAQNAEITLLTREGAEITFPKTKSVTACTGLMMALGLAFADPDNLEAQKELAALNGLHSLIQANVKSLEKDLAAVLPLIMGHEVLSVTGAGSNFGVALEAAIKVQEASNVITRGDSTAGLLHGPSGALDKRWLVLPLVLPADVPVTLELLGLVRKLGAASLAVVTPGVELGDAADHVLKIQNTPDPFIASLAFLPIVQLLAYQWAVARDLNPDSPKAMRAVLDAILPSGREEPELRK